MSLYAIDKLIDETRRLAAEFKRTTGTMLPVSGEIARYDVSHLLDLTLTNDSGCGYDATGNNKREGLRVQIKSRVIGDSVKSGHRLGQINPNGNWDIVILSLMNNAFEPLEMYQLSRNEVVNTLSNSHKKHHTISVAKFKIMGDLVWSKESGKKDLDTYQAIAKQR
jgi:hypothetical protein